MAPLEAYVFDEELEKWFLAYIHPGGICVVYDENGRVHRLSAPPPDPAGPCRNCLEMHDINNCQLECGYCGMDWHTIAACASIPRNRCKCSPFPQYHLARRCPVLCNPDDCPKKDVPGTEYHRNAVTCKTRCCMCGLYDHAGRDCHLKTCRCGRHHLAIEHPPEERRCAVEPCPRWFCNKHCQTCKEPSEACRCTKDEDGQTQNGQDQGSQDHHDQVQRQDQDQRQQPAPEPAARSRPIIPSS
ncbi:major facilitator superfamily transporter [Colletotrichum plurivorum]|uniref:Major facilitator superfamily transporter n=1 Tax=Colletotrichum plurivorum TaxID=2175906 RepID=A0A8H6KG19_9PEZI|nr:major facilitator superfamily transporter [Colletotrichum plurivorum]